MSEQDDTTSGRPARPGGRELSAMLFEVRGALDIHIVVAVSMSCPVLFLHADERVIVWVPTLRLWTRLSSISFALHCD